MMTTSRYSLGTIIVLSSALFIRDEIIQILLKTILLKRIERRESLEHRAVVIPEHFDEVLRRAIAEIEVARLGLDPACSRSEHLGQASACPPKQWRFRRSRRRQIFPKRLEDLSDEAIRRPVRETDLAS